MAEALIGLAAMAGAMSLGQGVTGAMNAKQMCQSLDDWNKQTAKVTEQYTELLGQVGKFEAAEMNAIGDNLDQLDKLRNKVTVARKLFGGTRRLQQIYGILSITLVFFMLLLKYFNFNALLKKVI
jgi:hypothetical protein